MLHQLTQNKFSRFMLTAGICLTTVFANQIDRNTQTTESTFNEMALDGMMQNGISLNGLELNGVVLNGISLNGLGLNGVALNGTGFNRVVLVGGPGPCANGVVLKDAGPCANGINSSRFELTSPTLTTAVLKQKPIQQIRLDGSQLALKIKRAD